MNIGHDRLATSGTIRVLAVVHTLSRYVPVLDLRFSYRSEDVITTLRRIRGQIGYPKIIGLIEALSSCRGK